jgi:hypothetical protein
MKTAIEKLEDAIRFHCGSYSSATVREEEIAQRIEKAKTLLAEGQWIIEDFTGIGLFNPDYHQKGFRPLRWMTKEGIATMQNLLSVKVGESFTREISFHPRHGMKTKTSKRLA